ncbi:hypothetical protein F5884DRAFT_343423 [Xylogone sp. PMI_703]|nr:hypothetical protein F5884DRAFT_343423 [Xylogone sp. PMI_703]
MNSNNDVLAASLPGRSDDNHKVRSRCSGTTTEKRRLQNRKSQQTYREKQKRLIQELKKNSQNEKANSSSRLRPLKPRAPDNKSADQRNSNHGDELPQQNENPPISSDGLSFGADHNEPQPNSSLEEVRHTHRTPFDPVDASLSWAPLDFEQDLLTEISPEAMSLESISMMEVSSSMAMPHMSNTQLGQPLHEVEFSNHLSIFHNPVTFSVPIENQSEEIPISANTTVASRSGRPTSPRNMDLSAHYMLPANRRQDADFSILDEGNALHFLQIEDNTETRRLFKSALDNKYRISDIFLAGLRALSRRAPTPPLPSPYANHISLSQVSKIEALLGNARALDLDIPSLWNPLTESQFYKPELRSADDANQYIATLPSSMPKDLRPVPQQILHSHSACIDLLPFPGVRARAIALASVTPPLLDLKELKNDIVHGGLVCWSANRASGQPWDSRTWEASKWFLKKWWILIEGEAGDMWQTASWWWKLRGEAVDRTFEEAK